MASRRVAVIVTALEKQGATARPTKAAGGWFIKFPNGDTVTIHGSESDARAEKNTRARVLRAGLTWPFDKK